MPVLGQDEKIIDYFLLSQNMWQPLSSKKLRLVTVLFTFMTITSCSEFSYEQFIKSTPQKFGLLTVTHARDGNFTFFQDFINFYAEMQCSLLSEISVVWNNQITPEEAGFSPSSRWKRPVYFVKTPFNSMDFRYLLPKESKADVFFSIDDDVQIKCKELSQSFKLWQKYAVGDLAPIMSYGKRGFSLTKQSSFVYNTHAEEKFSLMLIGIAWIPRFYLNLYNTDRSWEINQIREIVRSKNNCDDIALNFIVNYFFPEFISIGISGEFTMTPPKVSQSNMKTHYPYRNQCLEQFTKILEYNPLRVRVINEDGNETNPLRYVSAIKNQTIYLKRKMLASMYLTDSLGKQLQTQYFLKVFETAKYEHSENVYIPEILASKENIIISQLTSKLIHTIQNQSEILPKFMEILYGISIVISGFGILLFLVYLYRK